MAEWSLSQAFLIESAKREINACNDVEKLRDIAINLVMQTEALRKMTRELLLRDVPRLG